MSVVIINIIRKVLSYDIENPRLFGSLISDVVFKKQDAAIIMDNNGLCFLAHSNCNNFNELYQILTKLLSVLAYLEANGLIYRQSDDNKDELSVFYEGVNDLKKSTDGLYYGLGNGYRLLKNGDKFQVASSDNKIILAECHNISALYKELSYYFRAYIYPAAGLSDYIAHDYLSKSDYLNKTSLSVSRWSIRIAVGIACLSPIVSLLLGNQWGVTEIKECQYEQFIQRTAITDTIIIEKRDTIVKFVRDTIYTK